MDLQRRRSLRPFVKGALMFRLAFVALLVVASASRATADAPLSVVATFSILGDLVKNVGGDRVTVQTLVGPNGDTHAYTPKPTDAKKLAAAKLIFMNGLDFERWLDRLIDSAESKAQIVTTSRGVTPRAPSGGLADAPDPHAWQSVANTRIYVANIRDALIAADATSKEIYSANANAYTSQLDMLDRDIHDVIGRIPEAKRRVVIPHPSFGYFGAAYGLQFNSPQQLSNEAEASAKTVAAIVDAVRRDRISAMFVENARDPRLMQQIATETGVKLGAALFADALTDADGPAPTYIAMMRHNLHTIENALRD